MCSFDGCIALSTINALQNVSFLGDCVFDGCLSLHSLTLSDNVTEIGGWSFKDCPLKFITIPDGAINDSFGVSIYNGIFYDPFEGCTELKATANSFNMTVVEYFRSSYQKSLKEDRIKLRVWVLICIKRINDERINMRNTGLVNGTNGNYKAASNNSTIGGGGIYISRQALEGVLADFIITSKDVWREILEFI